MAKLIESRINSEPRASSESPALRVSMHEQGVTANANMNNTRSNSATHIPLDYEGGLPAWPK
jgi:hypothetical protein